MCARLTDETMPLCVGGPPHTTQLDASPVWAQQRFSSAAPHERERRQSFTKSGTKRYTSTEILITVSPGSS